MAGVGGTVHLRVLPNSRTFHSELKKQLENGKRVDYEVRIDPDLDRFNMALDQAERRIDDLDGRRVRLLLDVNDEQAAAAIDDFVRDAEREGVTKDLRVDTDQAGKDVGKFAQDQMEDPITKHLLVERNYADEEMMDFFRKHNGKTILQKVELDFGGRDPLASSIGGAYSGSRSPKKSIMGVRNSVDFDSEGLDAVNFMPRMLRSMNSQLDLGIRQVYDSYFSLFSKMYKFTSKPFFDFTNMARESKTLGEFLTGAVKPLRTMNSGFKKMFSAVPKGFRLIRDGAQAAWRGMKQIPTLLREVIRLAGAPFRLAARGISGLFGLFKSGTVIAIDKMRGAFVRIGQSLSGGFVNSVNGARMQLRRLAEGFTSSLTLMVSGPLMSKVYDSIRGIGGAGVNAASRLMSGFDFSQVMAHANSGVQKLTRGFSGMGFIFRKAIGNPFAGISRGASAAFSAVGKAWKTVSGAIVRGAKFLANAVTKPFKVMGSVIGKTFSVLWGGVKKGFSGLVSFFGPAISKISGIFGKLSGFAKSAFGAVSNVGKKIMGGLFNGALPKFFRNAALKMSWAFGSAFPLITKGANKAFGFIGKAFGKVLNNPTLWKGMQLITRRISTAAMGLSRVLMGTFAKIAGVLMKSLMPALMAVGAGVMALGGQAAIGAVMALLGAFTSVAAGAALMLPAVLGAAAVAFGVLKMGLDGVKDAMGSALSAETAKEFEEAIADAHPAVQNLARAMREFKPAIDSMKEAVQGNMLAGLDVGLRGAMNNLLPIFSEGAQKVASSWNKSLGGVLDELSSDRAASGLTALMAGVEEMSIAMEPTLANLVAAFGSLTEQGAKFLGPLGGWINGLSESFFGWAEGLKEIDETTGISKFDTMMESARVNAGHLGEILGGLFGTLGNVLQAAAEGGAGLLGGMGEGLRGLQEATEKGTDGYAAIVGFMEGAARAAASLKVIMEPLLMSVVSVGQILADVAYGAMPGIAAALTGLQIGLEGLTPYAEAFGASMGSVLESFAPLIASLGHALGPALAGLGEGLAKIFEPMKLGGPFDGFYLALKDLGPVLGNTFSVVGGAVGTIFAALAPLAESLLGMFNDFLPVFDLFAYWVGVIFGALLEMITPLVLMRDDAIGGLLDAIKPLIEVLGQGLLGVINALSPLMPMLGWAFSEIVKAVTPLIAPLTVLAEKLFLAFIDVIMMVMPIIPPLIAIIVGLVRVIAEKLIVIVNTFIDVWEKVWPKVSNILRTIINDFILPALGWLMTAFDKLGTFIGWVVDNAIVPFIEDMGTVFGVVMDGIVWVIDHLVKPALDGLKKAFSVAVDGIKSIWEGLKAIFAKPIKFFLETVINNGIIRGWNWIGPKIGLDPMETVNTGDLGNYASGGVLPGYSPGHDNYEFVDTKRGTRLGLSGGEAIMRPEWTKAVGGPKAVAEMNNAARAGKPLAYKDGGVYPMPPMRGSETGLKTNAIRAGRAISLKFPEVQVIGGYRAVDPYPDHPSGRALDVMVGNLALGDAIKDYLFANNSVFEMQYALWKQAQWNTAASGSPMGDRGNPTQNHMDHVHAYFNDSGYPTAGFDYGPVPEGAGTAYFGAGDGGGSWFNPALEAAKALLGTITSTVFDPLKGALSSQFGGNPFGMEAVGGLITNSVDAAVNKFTDTIASFFGGGGGDDGGVDLSSITGPIVSQIEQIFASHGFTGNQWDAAKWIVQQESSWDPNAQNPSSTAYGLFQFLDSTWAETGIGKTSDPKRQGEAGARYIKNRYGDPLAAQEFWRANNWYDQGGIASGIGMMQKNVITPERVLSPAQTAAFDKFVYDFMPELINEFRNNPRDLARHFGKLTGEITSILKELRSGHVSRLTDTMTSEFRRRANGENLAENPIDLMIDQGWFQRNQTEITENLNKASRRLGDVVSDPAAYLEAEAAARKRLEEEFEAEREKAKEEADEAKKKAQDEEDEARKAKEDAEDEAAKSDEEREALKAQREAEAEARKEVADSEKEAADKRTQEEEAKIEAAKADGSFYYGYKTFAADGSNPNPHELTAQEQAFRSFMNSVGERTGLGDTVTGIAKRADMVSSIGAAAQTAAPAWMAALNGDPTGLAFNVAAGTAQVAANAATGAAALAPSAIAGILEMAISGASSNNAPFIENLNSGMTQAELMQTLDHYQARRARMGTGTTRVR